MTFAMVRTGDGYIQQQYIKTKICEKITLIEQQLEKSAWKGQSARNSA